MHHTGQVFVIPAAGRTVLNNNTGRPIPPDGELVVLDMYIRRRIKDGDLSLVREFKKSKPKQAPVTRQPSRKQTKQKES